MADAPGSIAACARQTRARVEFDPEKDPGPVPSPCTGVCRVSPVTGWCEGCERRLEEIGGWLGMDEAGRREVWRCLLHRRGQAQAAGQQDAA